MSSLQAWFVRWFHFWQAFPNKLIAILSTGLILSGGSMLYDPVSYRSFYLDVGPFVLTPTMAGLASLVCALICLGTKASYIGVALVAATFIGRGALLFTAWSMARVDPPPPATRWLWEVLNGVIVLYVAGRIVRTVR